MALDTLSGRWHGALLFEVGSDPRAGGDPLALCQLQSLDTRLRGMLGSRQVEEVVRGGRQRALQRRGLEQALQHAAGAAVLKALVGGQRVLGAVAAVAELAHVQRVRLLVLVLEMALEGVVAGEGAAAVGALLRLVDAPRCGRRHAEDATCEHPHKYANQ